VVAYVRTVKTASGATAVLVVTVQITLDRARRLGAR
jgi:hypothetical protein